MSLSSIIAAGSRQRIHSRVRVPWDSRPYVTVTDSRLPFLSPLTTRRTTVEVFDPASTQASVSVSAESESYVTIKSSQSYIATDGRSISNHDQIFIIVWQLRSCFYGAPSLTRGRVCLLYNAAGPRRRSLSRIRVPWISRPYITASVLRLPFSSPPLTRRVTVEVFNPASTRVMLRSTLLSP
jgi:hypothetical protein